MYMLFFAAPRYSSIHERNYRPIHQLREMVNAQQEDVKLLCTIVGNLRGYMNTALDNEDTTKYRAKIDALTERQNDRFEQIDGHIYANYKELKKEQTTDRTVLDYGKEARKLEAGLRTIKLFTSDAIDMLKPSSTSINRSEERIRYVETRSAALDLEMRTLHEKIPSL